MNITCLSREKGEAETLFKEINTKNHRAYSSMIKGRAKYLQTDKAFELYREMKALNMPGEYHIAILHAIPLILILLRPYCYMYFSVGVETHNAVIKILGFLKDTPAERYEMVMVKLIICI